MKGVVEEHLLKEEDRGQRTDGLVVELRRMRATEDTAGEVSCMAPTDPRKTVEGK